MWPACAWFVLAAAGQFASLQAIDAGKGIHYQHYRPLPVLFESHPALLAVLAIQAAAVAWGFTRHAGEIRSWVGRRVQRWQMVALAVVFYLPVAALSRDVPAYVAEFAFASVLQTLSLANVVLFSLALPAEAVDGVRQKLAFVFETRRTGSGLDRFTLLAALWVTVVSGFLAVAVYQKHPHLEDEVVYLYQARFLASGHLSLPAPPVPRAFETYLMDFGNGRWFPTPPAGWPAVLAVGVLLGAPWAVNPVLAGVNILLISLLLSALYDRRIARICVLLFAASPWYLLLAMSYMTHILSLTFALLTGLGIVWSRKTGNARWAWMAGAAGGAVSLIRPLEGAIVLALAGLAAIGFGGRRLRLSALAGLVAGAVLTGSLVFPYNQRLTGKARVFPVMAYTDRVFGKNSNALGFGPDRGRGFSWALDPYPGHGWRDVVVNSELNAFGLNTELLGWPTGSLLLAGIAVFAAMRRRSDWFMITAILVVFAANALYWFSGGPDFGARYWFLMILPLIALTARGIEELQVYSPRIVPAVAALALFALILYIPWRAIDKYYGYLRMKPDAIRLAAAHHFGRSLVLVRGARFPDYASVSAYNPLNLSASEPIYVWDENPQVRRQVLQSYPDRPVWVIEGPTLTSDGTYRIQAGPLRADELIR